MRLAAPDPERDAPALFAAAHGDDADPEQWIYMGYGPFADADAMAVWMAGRAAATEPRSVVVHDRTRGVPVGMAAFMSQVPENRRLEIGNVWYVPSAQRTAANTETTYLMLREAFEHCGYRRVEWKCDARNRRSRVAAERLGFSFEGLFRNHMIIKQQSRDTAWYAITDDEWPALRSNYDAVLDRTATRALGDLNRPLLRPRVQELG